MASGGSFYITTPIFYVNDVPHIGHAYTEVAADTLARWHRQRGEDTWLLTGTDEHGQKILRSAVANGSTPREWTDRLVETAWKPLLDTIEIANDDFIRTTDERHETAVARFFEHLKAEGHIYTGEYEGYYCVGCEEYKQPDELDRATEGEFAGELVCRIHSRPVELLQERNYFFRMSAFQEQLLALYRDRPDFVQPESLRNEIVRFVEQGLQDLSISRSSFDWGIQVPWDDSHVIYVWVDALLNYITAIGWGDQDPGAVENFDRRWPAVHVVGKDIARFHAVIWPAMLLAAGLEVPRQVFGHGWLLVGGEKMSKSKLTGIAPHEITDVFGADAFRYYFLRAISFGQDGSFSWEDISARYHAELANGLGNLASRVIAMVERYRGGAVPAATSLDSMALDSMAPDSIALGSTAPGSTAPGEAEQRIRDLESSATSRADAAIDRLAIHEAIAAVWELVDALNLYITEQQPWVLAKGQDSEGTGPDDAARLDAVLATAVHGLGALAVLLSPVMPATMQRLWNAVGGEGDVRDVPISEAPAWTGSGRVTPLAETLFPRIETDKDAATA